MHLNSSEDLELKLEDLKTIDCIIINFRATNQNRFIHKFKKKFYI